MKKLEPLKFNPIFAYRIWAGDQLKTVLQKPYSEFKIGESWELSGVKNQVSIVSEGCFKGERLDELIRSYGADLVGESVYNDFGNEFPILIKFIDAAQDLSIQVHPGDELAKTRHNSLGKTEMWYVITSEDDARLIVGFKEGVTKEHYQKALKEECLESLLQYHHIKEGDTFFIPTGTIHAIGAGTLLAEIQQTSDVTYRVYDFNRIDKDGNKRELHTDLALEALNYNGVDGFKQSYTTDENQPNTLVHCPYFKTNFIPLNGSCELNFSARSSFTILMSVKGAVEIEVNKKMYVLNFGETILIPAQIEQLTLKGTAHLIEVFY
jgi:mannose-6-phosphate isomerase